MLLDLENVYVNSMNHGFGATEFLNDLPPGIVSGIHVAGGTVISREYLQHPFWIDSHSRPIPDQVMRLLDQTLDQHRPETIVLERDEELGEVEDILRDIGRIRDRLSARREGNVYVERTAAGSSN